MKSRLAVSVLFIMIAATFSPDAIGAFEKFRSWTGRLYDRCSIQICNRVISRDSAPTRALKAGDERRVAIMCLDGECQPPSQSCATANQPCVTGAISPDGKTITLSAPDASKILSSHEGRMQGVVLKLVGSDHRPESFAFMRTAAGQIREVLDLMHIK